MSKYIDADSLIHDLEGRIYAYSEGYADGDDCRKDAIETLLKDVRYQCSLQQEQPAEGLEDDKIIDYAHSKFYYDKDFDGYGHSKFRPVLTREDLISFARHFAEWGRKQVLQEIYDGKVKPVDKITAAWLDDEQNT